jgi:hypothetical protein
MDNTHRLITKARLELSSPEVVYDALEEYGKHVLEGKRFGENDKDLERALANRNSPLIDLGLAKNASSHELVAELYTRSLEGSGDPDYDKRFVLHALPIG